MKRFLIPALAASALTATSALGAAVIVYDMELTEKFEAKRDIVDMVQEVYGETAVYSTGDELPEDLDAALTPRQPLPETVEISAVPEPLMGKLPHTEEGTKWYKVGDHLVEVGADNMIVMTVYDVLP